MTNKLRTNTLILWIFIAILAASCGPTPTLTPEATLPAPQVTIVNAGLEQPQTTPEPTNTIVIPSPTVAATLEVTPTQTEIACTNQAEFVKSLSISDNTKLDPGTLFTKMWQVRNVGTCIWTADYQLVMVGGDSMQAPYAIRIPHEVRPQETIDLGVKMIAPQTPNTYSNTWVLMDADGNYFGVGNQYDQPLVAQIVIPTVYQLKPT